MWNVSSECHWGRWQGGRHFISLTMNNISVATYTAVCSGRKYLDTFKALLNLSHANKKSFQKVLFILLCTNSTEGFSNSCLSNFSEKPLHKPRSLKYSKAIEWIHITAPHSPVQTRRCFSSDDKLLITSDCVKWLKR